MGLPDSPKTLGQIIAGRVIVVARQTALGKTLVVGSVPRTGTGWVETTTLATSRAGALAVAEAIRELAEKMS